jgi:hypothetical protein
LLARGGGGAWGGCSGGAGTSDGRCSAGGDSWARATEAAHRTSSAAQDRLARIRVMVEGMVRIGFDGWCTSTRRQTTRDRI